MAWETIKPGTGRGRRLPDNIVSIHKNGNLCISSIRKQLGNYVELFYDSDTNRMALKVAQKSDNNFEVKKDKRNNSWYISLIRFINFYDLQDAMGKRYWVTREDDMFVIDLTQPIYHLDAL